MEISADDFLELAQALRGKHDFSALETAVVALAARLGCKVESDGNVSKRSITDTEKHLARIDEQLRHIVSHISRTPEGDKMFLPDARAIKAVEFTPEQQKLAEFYDVTTRDDLIATMQQQIMRLQELAKRHDFLNVDVVEPRAG